MKRWVFIENIRGDPGVLGTAKQRVCLGEVVEVLVFDSAPVERSRVEVFDQIANFGDALFVETRGIEGTAFCNRQCLLVEIVIFVDAVW